MNNVIRRCMRNLTLGFRENLGTICLITVFGFLCFLNILNAHDCGRPALSLLFHRSEVAVEGIVTNHDSIAYGKVFDLEIKALNNFKSTEELIKVTTQLIFDGPEIKVGSKIIFVGFPSSCSWYSECCFTYFVLNDEDEYRNRDEFLASKRKYDYALETIKYTKSASYEIGSCEVNFKKPLIRNSGYGVSTFKIFINNSDLVLFDLHIKEGEVQEIAFHKSYREDIKALIYERCQNIITHYCEDDVWIIPMAVILLHDIEDCGVL